MSCKISSLPFLRDTLTDLALSCASVKPKQSKTQTRQDLKIAKRLLMRSGAADEVRRRARNASRQIKDVLQDFQSSVFARHPDGLGFVLRSVKPKQSKTQTRQDLKIVKRLLMRSGVADEVWRRARNASRQVMDVLQDFQSSVFARHPDGLGFVLHSVQSRTRRKPDKT